MKHILLLGRLVSIVDQLTNELSNQDIVLHGATNIEETKQELNSLPIDVVIMGGGLDDDIRAELCKLVWSQRDDLCIHIKDRASGPGPMADFIKGVIKGFT